MAPVFRGFARPRGFSSEHARDVHPRILVPTALAELESSLNPAHTLARHWTTVEARLKLTRRPLTEWAGAEFPQEPEPFREYRYESGATIVFVVT